MAVENLEVVRQEFRLFKIGQPPMSPASVLQTSQSVMRSTRSDHPVFTRLTRQQLVVRRRHLGFQALILKPPTSKTSVVESSPRRRYCSYCHRSFTPVWKPYLCHVCGHWVCEPCSRVMEREREELVIRFVRCCERCRPLLNQWTPNVDELAAFTFSPWVVQSSVSPLGVNLAEMLRSRPERRQAVLSLLRHLGKDVDTMTGVLEDISENEWAATVSSSNFHHDSSSDRRTSSRLIRDAQYFVQQCLDVRIPEVHLDKCVLAEMDGCRSYPVAYPSPTEPPELPTPAREAERGEWIMRYKLREESSLTEEVAMICDLAAKELEAHTGLVSVILGDQQWFMPASRSFQGIPLYERKHSFSAHLLLSESKPFLVRNAQLDIRFRHYKIVTVNDGVSLFFGVPILAGDGAIVANLLVVDPKPRKSVTTMQYSVVTALAEVLSAIWKEAFVLEDSTLAKDRPDTSA